MERDRKLLKDLIGTLKELGFTNYKAKVLAYLSLNREPLEIAKLSSLTDVPRTKVYSVVSSLEEEGLVKVQEGRPMRVSAPPPDELASLIIEKVLSDTSAKLSRIEGILKLNLTEGLWVVEKSTLPVKGERVISGIAVAIIKDAKEKINLILSEKNSRFLPKRLPNIVSAVVESPSTRYALSIPRARCRIVGRHGIFMVLSERACVFSDEELKRGVFTSEESLISAFSDLFKGLYASGVTLPSKGLNGGI
ncbi:MAG: helix-turn-helix domain-containing protein [Candidatus Korarchaeum sp.]|nr:helix-turn-helix domain-containing protein [Candidatus Korarchaeum sp.]MDW8035531.1 helix-turn-helix domain-containing protein [Candidatus Korarchaeum sp.]